MFRWLIRGLVFLFIAFGLSNTNLEPNTGFCVAIAVFAMFYGALGLLVRAYAAYGSYRLTRYIKIRARRVRQEI
jgi:hypothetical protein